MTSGLGAAARAGRSWVRGPWSLRRRLLVVLAALVAVGLVVADGVTYHTLRSYLLNRENQQLDALAHGNINRLLNDFGPGPPRVGGGATQAFVQLRDQSGTPLRTISAYQSDGTALAAPRLPAALPTPPAGNGPDGGDAADYLTVPSTASGQGPYRVRVSQVVVVNGPFSGEPATLVVATPLTDMVATLHKLVWTEVGVSLGAVLVALAAGAWLVRVGLRPLEAMADTADEIAAGRLDRRVDAADATTEVGRLGTALNSMLGRIEHAFAEKEESEHRLRRFIADASHELRTPLTSIRGYAELFRRGADRRPEDLAKSMNRIEAEATRMGLLVEDLLLLARLDQGRPLEAERLDLGAVVGEAVDAARAVEPDRAISAELDPDVTVVGDRNRLRQVVDNLLTNVRLHTAPGAPARVHLAATGGLAVLEVDDSGPGLDSEVASKVFERFFRADPSRSQDTGGAGLGLSIVHAIATAHGGSVEAGNRPDGPGARFVLRLPLAPVEAGGWAAPGDAGTTAASPGAPGDADAHGRPGNGAEAERREKGGVDPHRTPRIGSGRSQA
ncbi:MAG TPA: HAMP domain-containing sensor histidine kinase [Acidimicrobiales bacterium]|nr:HAMP domain-containing sensor histidine kinase [Acidimicrobiales bacterium]